MLEAIKRAGEFLLASQSADGLWRDYDSLEPGCSEGWVTGVVAWSLTLPPSHRRTPHAVFAAAESLHAIAQDDGWGYNRNTASDADSTAWIWRFLTRIDRYGGRSAIVDLSNYLEPGGLVRTFRGTRFGAWASAHADVTPVLGLALHAIQEVSKVVDGVRKTALGQRSADGLWDSYWWTSRAYAIARNLEFLVATGGIPEEIRRRAVEWLSAQPDLDKSSFVVAQELAAAVLVDREMSRRRGETLLEMQQSDGGWAASRALLVPAQLPGLGQAESLAADEQRLMSTAMSMVALKSWLTRR